jgi:hypothetical protein
MSLVFKTENRKAKAGPPLGDGTSGRGENIKKV